MLLSTCGNIPGLEGPVGAMPGPVEGKPTPVELYPDSPVAGIRGTWEGPVSPGWEEEGPYEREG